ncbi:MAG TPA: DEAD/DEAH box helicase [Rhodanobacteraceae bacterium]
MDTDDLQDLLYPGSWEGKFDARTLARAKGYYRYGRVCSLVHIEDDGEDVLSGKVQGTRPKPYACTVRLYWDDDELELDTECSCPVGHYCKHAAAMLMVASAKPSAEWPGARTDAARRSQPVAPVSHAVIAAPQPQPLLEWKQWLHGLGPQPDGAASRVAEADRQFALLLHVGPGRPLPSLQVSPVWLRPSRSKTGIASGRLVDPQPLRLDAQGPVPEPAGGWPADVAGALAILLQGPTASSGQRRWDITAGYQENALLALLTRYPAYFERASTPLRFAEARPLRLRWRDLADGSQQLDADVAADEPVQLLRGNRLWYLLQRARCFGQVDAGPELVHALAHVPVVQPDQANALRQLLARTGTPLPLPAERGAPETIGASPLPVLELHLLKTAYDFGNPALLPGVARLMFDYAGHRLRPDTGEAEVLKWQDGRLLAIRRQPDAEQRAADRLSLLGFEPADWYVTPYGRPAGQLQPDDLLLKPQRRQVSLPAAEWQPVIDTLRAEGFRIDYADGFPHTELVAIDGWHADLAPSGAAWFDVSLGVDIGGERISLLPILRALIADPAFPRKPAKAEKKDATWRVRIDAVRSVALPLARVRALIEPLLEWLETDSEGAPRVHRTQLAELGASGLAWHGGEDLRAELEALRSRQHAAVVPRGFKASLRPYQLDGLAWLDFLADARLGGILADDMGLGKTVQVLAHILGEKQRGRLAEPALVIVPTSLVGNWQAEAARFTPALSVLVLQGAERAERYVEIPRHDLVLTTYPLLRRDRDKLLAATFSLLVLDEAQAIKNAASQAAHVVRAIPAKRRLAMTGTPLENHLGELWAEFDAVEPGLLGSQRQFTRFYRTPIEKHGDAERQQRLNRRIGALLLRRRKEDVLTDLPPKTEIVRMLELEDDQRALYETLRLAQHERVRQAIAERGLARSGVIVLDALLKLRQACCDPHLVKLASAKKVKTSAKLEALLELVSGLLDGGRRILLFSQFTEMLALIEAALAKRGIGYQTLTGQTPARQRTALVKHFQQGDVPLFLISLKAGGVGLNLTAADTVIHYDPWWNPAVEAQATDRAHRIGQNKSVFVYRLLCKGTVEEKIQAMQARKAGLVRAVLEGGGASTRLRFNAADLDALFGVT